MSVQSCTLDIENSFNKVFNRKQIKEIVDKVEDWRKKGLDEDTIKKLAFSMAKEKRKAAALRKLAVMLNETAKKNTKESIKNIWGDDLEQGMRAFLGESLALREKARYSLANQVSTARDSARSSLASELAKSDLISVVKDPSLDKETARAMAILNTKPLDKAALANINEASIKAAEILNDHRKIQRMKAAEMGIDIDEIDGFFSSRSYDSLKMSKAAGADVPVNSPKHLEKVVDDLEAGIDWSKSFIDVIDPLERRKVLKEFLAARKEGLATGVSPSQVAKTKDLMGRFDQRRKIHFKDFDSEWDFFQKYGNADTMFESAYRDIDAMARDLTIMENLGPDAQNNMQQIFDELIDETRRTDEVMAGKMKAQADNLMENLWPVITDDINQPANNTRAKWGAASSFVRRSTTASQLMGASIMQMMDPALAGLHFRYTGDRSYSDFFQGMRNSFKAIFSDYGLPVNNLPWGVGKVTDKFSKITPEVQQMASEFGILIESLVPHPTKFEVDYQDIGRMGKFFDHVMKFSFISQIQDRVKLGAVVAAGHRHFNHASKAFGDLPSGMQDYFLQFGIDEGSWDAIRKVKPSSDHAGREFFTADSVKQIPDSFFLKQKEIAKIQNEKLRAKEVVKAREDLRKRYMNLFHDTAAVSSSEPKAIERAMFLQGTKPGTWKGEAFRHFAIYKSIVANVTRTHMGREFHGYNFNKVSNAQAIRDMLSGRNKSGMGGMANLLAASMVLGYGIVSAKALSKNQTPPMPEDFEDLLKIAGASLLQAGTLGIYGDFLLGDLSRYGNSPLATFMGPTAGKIEDVYDIFAKTKSGKNAGKNVFNFVMNNAPGLSSAKNHFMLRGTLDYLIMYRLNEMMNPGYMRRMQRNLRKEKKELLFRP